MSAARLRRQPQISASASGIPLFLLAPTVLNVWRYVDAL